MSFSLTYFRVGSNDSAPSAVISVANTQHHTHTDAIRDGSESDDLRACDDSRKPQITVASKDAGHVPFHIISAWNEPRTTTKVATTFFLLPSGITEDMFELSVAQYGLRVNIRVQWPEVVHNVHHLFYKWLKAGSLGGFADYHPHVLAMERAFANLRRRASQALDTTTKISLLF